MDRQILVDWFIVRLRPGYWIVGGQGSRGFVGARLRASEGRRDGLLAYSDAGPLLLVHGRGTYHPCPRP